MGSFEQPELRKLARQKVKCTRAVIVGRQRREVPKSVQPIFEDQFRVGQEMPHRDPLWPSARSVNRYRHVTEDLFAWLAVLQDRNEAEGQATMKFIGMDVRRP